MTKYACVTGADRGLGYELVKQLLAHEYTVFAGRYNIEWTLLDDLKKTYPDRLVAVDLDVSTDESVAQAVAFIRAQAMSLEVLVNNSAITGDNISTIADPLNFDEMLKVYNVNAVGALRVTNALYPLIAAGAKKLIMNISSEAGSIGSCHRKGWFAYCSSKAALNMMSAITHNNLKEIGGQVILIQPGWMKTWLSGKYHDEGPLTPDIPAARLIEIIESPEKYKGNSPAYIDYEGNPLQF